MFEGRSYRVGGGAEVVPFPPKLNETMEDEGYILCDKKGEMTVYHIIYDGVQYPILEMEHLKHACFSIYFMWLIPVIFMHKFSSNEIEEFAIPCINHA